MCCFAFFTKQKETKKGAADENETQNSANSREKKKQRKIKKQSEQKLFMPNTCLTQNNTQELRLAAGFWIRLAIFWCLVAQAEWEEWWLASKTGYNNVMFLT